MTDAHNAIDEALGALAEITVALSSLYPIMGCAVGVPDAARGFVEDGMEAASRARRHLNDARLLYDGGRYSVGVGTLDASVESELEALNERMAKLSRTVAELMADRGVGNDH